MTKLAKAYKMLKTCYIKTGTVIVVHEEFTAGKVYATVDIPEPRLLVWLQEGFCIPAVSGAEVTAIDTPEKKAEAADKVAADKAKETAAAAKKKADAETKKQEKKRAEKEAKAAKKAQADAKEKAAAEANAAREAEKKANAEKVQAEAEEKALVKAEAEAEAEAEKLAPLFDLWADVPVADYPKYVELAKEGGYELDDAPDDSDPAAWLAYFVPFFGESGPPPLPKAE